ncbi:uncharacterized protein LOC106655025 [Trichogramma pretiosum]|uniref:uncharacterized protein LOC106655025 n=1 Tax=Trichogramma pretiosum TaxID=7493 RepID=UPI000C71AFEB|nr:uncharacterized protein LOC106655025 [Trichogramma pretiosum]
MIVTVYATSWARSYFNTDDLSINVRENKNLNGNENLRLDLASTSRPLHTVDVQNQNLPLTRNYILSDIIQSFRNKNWKLDDKNGFSDEKKSEKRGMDNASGGVSDEFSSRRQLPEKKLALKHKLYEELTTKSSESARKKAEPLQGSIIFDSHEDTVTASSSAIMTPDIDDNHNNDNLEVGFDSSHNHPQISVTDKPISGKKIEKLQGTINSDDSDRLKYEDNGAEIPKATSGLAGSTRPSISQISNSVTSKNLNGTKIPHSVENPKFDEKSANENTSLLQKVGPVLKKKELPKSEETISGLAGSSGTSISQIADPITGKVMETDKQTTSAKNKKTGDESSPVKKDKLPNKNVTKLISPISIHSGTQLVNSEKNPKVINLTAPEGQKMLVSNNKTQPLDSKSIKKSIPLIHEDDNKSMKKTKASNPEDKKLVNITVPPNASTRNVAVPKSLIGPSNEKKTSGLSGSSGPAISQILDPVSGKNKGIRGSSSNKQAIEPSNSTAPVKQDEKINNTIAAPVNHTGLNKKPSLILSNKTPAASKTVIPVTQNKKQVNATVLPSASTRDVVVLKNHTDRSNEKKTSGLAGSSGPAILQISDPVSGKNRGIRGSSNDKQAIEPSNSTAPMKQDEKINNTIAAPVNHTGLNKKPSLVPSNKTAPASKTVIPVTENKKPVDSTVMPSASTRDVVVLKNHTDPSTEKKTSGLAASSGPTILQVSDPVSGQNKGIGGSSGSGKDIKPTNLTAPVQNDNKIHKNGTYPVSQINSNKTLPLVPGNKTTPAPKKVNPVIKNKKPVNATVMPSASTRDVVVLKNHTDPSNEKKTSGLAASSGPTILQLSDPVSGQNKGIGGSSGSGKDIKPTNLTAPVQNDNKIHKNGTYPVSQLNSNKTLPLVPGEKIAPASKTVSPVIKNEKPINATVMPSTSTRDVVVLKNHTDPSNEKKTSGLAGSSGPAILQISDPVSGKNKGIRGSSSNKQAIEPSNSTAPMKQDKKNNNTIAAPVNHTGLNKKPSLVPSNKTAPASKTVSPVIENEKPINATVLPSASTRDVVVLKNHTEPSTEKKTGGFAGSSGPSVLQNSSPVSGENKSISGSSGSEKDIKPTNPTVPVQNDIKIHKNGTFPISQINSNKTLPLVPGDKTAPASKTVSPVLKNQKPVNATVMPSTSSRDDVVLKNHTDPSNEKKTSRLAGSSGPAILQISDPVSSENKGISGSFGSKKEMKPTNLTELVKQDDNIADTVKVPMNKTKLSKPHPLAHDNQITDMPKTVIPVLQSKKPVNATISPSASIRDVVALKNHTDPSNDKKTSGLAASSGPTILQVLDPVSGQNKGIGGSSGSGKDIKPTNLIAPVQNDNKIHKNGTYPVSQINSNKTLPLVPGDKTAPASKTVSPVIKNEKPINATVMPSASTRDVVVLKNRTDPSNDKKISGLAASSGPTILQVSDPLSGKRKGIGGSFGSGKKIKPTNLTAPVQNDIKIHKNGTYPVSQINSNKTLPLVPGDKTAPASKTVSPVIKNEKPINATVMPSASTRDVEVLKNHTDPSNEKKTSGLAASSRPTILQISDPASAKNKGISGSSGNKKVIKPNNVTVPIKPSLEKNKKNSEPLQGIPFNESAPLSVGNKTANIPKTMDFDVLNRLPVNSTIRPNGSIVDVVGLKNHNDPKKEKKTKISDPVFGINEGINALSATGKDIISSNSTVLVKHDKKTDKNDTAHVNHTNLNNTEPLGPGKKTATTPKTVGSEKHNEKPVNLPSASMRDVIVLNSSTVPSVEKKLSGSSGASGPSSTLSDLISGKIKSISGSPITGIDKKPVHLTNPSDISQLNPTRPTKIVNIKFSGPTVVNVVKSKDGSRPFVVVNVPYYLQYPRSLSSHSPPSTNKINSRSDELINTEVSRVINDSFQKQATSVFDSYNDKTTASFDSTDYDLSGDSVVGIKENSGIPTYPSMNRPPLNSIKPGLNIISSTSCVREIGDVFLDNLTLIQLYASDRPQLDDNYPGYKITCIRCSSISNGLRKELGLTIVRSGNGCRYIFDRRELDLSNLLGYCQIFGRRRRWNDQAVLPC